jgi:catalase
MQKKDVITTAAGIPVSDNQNSLTVGPRGPLLVQDWQLAASGASGETVDVVKRLFVMSTRVTA